MELKQIKRDANGLIDGIQYTYNEDGFIDWRKMIKPEFLVPNKQLFENAGKSIPNSIEGLEDKDLLILLAGIKYLARVRGYSSVEYTLCSPAPEYVSAVCKITWNPNYETENKSIIFSGVGDASYFNTSGFGKNFLGPIAENRAFVRCVRNFLNITILGQDEISSDKNAEEPNEIVISTAGILSNKMAERKMTFENIKHQLIKENFPNATELKEINDLPKGKILELIDRLVKNVPIKK